MHVFGVNKLLICDWVWQSLKLGLPFNSNERFKLYQLVGGSTGPRYRLLHFHLTQ